MSTAALPRSRRLSLKVALLLASLAVTWIITEFALQWNARRIAQSSRLQPGMMQYDPTLGWRLTPGWTGEHVHADYRTTYAINRFGFRSDTRSLETSTGEVLAVIGDSFTFGYGVADDETFVHLLAEALGPNRAVANFAVPGTSTDQQLLLVEDRLELFDTDEIVLVVYLGNDLLDNLRSIAIQTPNPKPFFQLEGGELHVQNNPVPRTQGAIPDAQGNMRRAVLGEDTAEGWRQRVVSRSALLNALWTAVQPESVDPTAMLARHEGSLDLFDALIKRMQEECERQGVRLHVALLAGRSHVMRPESLSGQYQEMLRREILRRHDRSSMHLIDLAGGMLDRAGAQSKQWYFKHDGHLTPQGHQEVAGLLLDQLSPGGSLSTTPVSDGDAVVP